MPSKPRKQKRDRWSEVVVLRHDLKALLFWASIGIERSVSGSYRDAEGEGGIVDSYARGINYSIPAPYFRER